METAKTIILYYSCSHFAEDQEYRDKLNQQLTILRRQKHIVVFHDDSIKAGEKTAQRAVYLEEAQIIVILLSADYLDADDCYAQMERALQRHQACEAHVVPVLLRPIHGWEETFAAHAISVLPTGERAINQWTNLDEAYANIAARIHQLVDELLARQQRTLSPPQHRSWSKAPSQHSTILPRGTLVKEIYQTVTVSELSALVLTGLDGIGKSTLAAQVYHYAEKQRLAGESPFTKPTLWLRLQPTTTLYDVLAAIAEQRGAFLPEPDQRPSTELGIAQVHSSSPLANQLIRTMSEPEFRQLIILDQFDTWLDLDGTPRAGQEALADWLDLLNQTSSTTRVLITSRLFPHSIHFRRPIYVQEKKLAGLEDEGLALLRLWNVEGSTTDLQRAVELCAGHPLALELLYALLKKHHLHLTTLLNNPQYQQQWARDMEKHLFDALFDQLSPSQQDFLFAFSVYREAIPLAAIQGLIRTHSSEELPLETVSSLTDQHLLQIQGTGLATHENLYELHPLLANFAYARFVAQQHRASWRAAHASAAEYYRHLPTLPGQRRARNALLEAIWHYCQAAQWQKGYMLLEQEKLFPDLLRRGEYTLLLELYTSLQPSPQWQPPSEIAWHIYNALGEVSHHLGDNRAAEEHFVMAWTQAQLAGTSTGEVKALNNLGSVYRAQDRIEEALDCYQQALTIGEQAQEPVEKGITLNNLGRAVQSQALAESTKKIRNQHYRQALAYYEQALAIHNAARDEMEAAYTRENMGEVYDLLGQREKAHRHYQQALITFREIGNRRGEGITCHNLGLFYRNGGDLLEAFDYYVQALRIFREIHDRWHEATTLRNVGWLYLLIWQEETALAFFLQASDIFAELHRPAQGALPLLVTNERSLEQIRAEIGPYANRLVEDALKDGIHFVEEDQLDEGASR
jgi:tetratricopeptide (TPR) repeat protein